MHILSGRPGQRRFLLGNEAIARGALEAGASFFSCYPGTPSSEILDSLIETRAKLAQRGGEEPPFQAEYSVNEKVALEVAAGAALGGAASLVAMKHVGLNVAADPLFTAAYIGLPGGLVIVTADDPGCHSSQNEQDNRHYARAAHLPCFEPASPGEALAMTREAFRVAKLLQLPVLLRTTTRVNHSRGPVVLSAAPEPAREEFQRDPGRFVPVPMVARKRRRVLDVQTRKAADLSEKSPFNQSFAATKNPGEYGIVASGVARAYLRDALELLGVADEIAILELGATWPLPETKIADFLGASKRVLVLEEGEPLLEKDVRAIAQKRGLAAAIAGKDEKLTAISEFSTSIVRDRVLRWLGRGKEQPPAPVFASLPPRPPALCPGCAHRAVYRAARTVFGDDAVYSSDIGCYTLGMAPPLNAADFMICMGSSVTAGSGFATVANRPVIAFIGDSTFFHSGMTGLMNAVHNKRNLLLVILDNGTTAMTGHQPHPGMAPEALGERAEHLDIETVVRGLGVRNCERAPAANLRAMVKAMERLKDAPGVRVLIAAEPCALFARRVLKRKKKVVAVVARQGEATENCVRALGCPAFFRKDGEIRIDKNLCAGCLLCAQTAPGSFKAVAASRA